MFAQNAANEIMFHLTKETNTMKIRKDIVVAITMDPELSGVIIF